MLSNLASRLICAIVPALLLIASTAAAQAPQRDTIRVPGLTQPVEVLRDRRGVPHIYAQNEHDLFFAQGYSAARDRLVPARALATTGDGNGRRVARPREVQRDIGARLFKFRGNMATELARYHPHGAAIVGAFVDGINAYVAETERDPPSCAARVPAARHEAGPMDAGGRRLAPSRAARQHHRGAASRRAPSPRSAPASSKKSRTFIPAIPTSTLDPAIDGSLLSAPILALYQAFRAPLRFQPTDVVASRTRRQRESSQRLAPRSIRPTTIS